MSNYSRIIKGEGAAATSSFCKRDRHYLQTIQQAIKNVIDQELDMSFSTFFTQLGCRLLLSTMLYLQMYCTFL